MFTLELGTGWAPTSVDDAAEFDFIQEKERISPDDRSYWIGRWFSDTLESRGYSKSKSKLKYMPLLHLKYQCIGITFISYHHFV